ncbi:unnamed protein product [Symbiodinium natans]|uniref:Uncharacterized protein n=1 Tax=Symbiodinium natans TaxID=878477 RepID=A0A812G9Z2_9DINO|nr:unnamed protein product [Symbiodinium natans]
MATTILPHSMSTTQLSALPDAVSEQEAEDLRSIVAQLEAMQAQQRSPQQPNLKLDGLILQLIVGHPERRHRMAVMTKSALLRKKILSIVPPGGRAVGAAVLGSTYEWRQRSLPDVFSDCNWPKASHNAYGIHHLPGGGSHHDRLLRSPADKRTHHPLLPSSEFHSFPRAKRFPGTHGNGELNPEEVQKRAVPGPGTYMKSVPGGSAFSVDGGETVILGANHTYPWKKALGRQINPIESDATNLVSAPCYTFAKTRRTVSDTAAGHGLQDGGPVKTDTGCLSPGFVYELHSTMRPLYGNRTLDGTQSCVRRKIRQRLKDGHVKQRVRCIPMPLEAPTEPE